VLNLHKKVQGIVEGSRAVLTYARSYTQKTFFGPPSEALVMPFSMQNLVKNTKNELLSVNDSGAHFFYVQYRI
jgi:hypothetical protein